MLLNKKSNAKIYYENNLPGSDDNEIQIMKLLTKKFVLYWVKSIGLGGSQMGNAHLGYMRSILIHYSNHFF
jgi:hypothetical protein